jgi:tellurite resistance protein TerC
MSWETILPYGGFLLFVLAMLAIDLGIFNRKSHAISIREAAIWTAVWVSLAALFAGGLWLRSGSDRALEFVAGYLIEYSLSMDNIFVFVLIFTFFAVPTTYQHRVLFWGILGALVMRGLMIGAGAALMWRVRIPKRDDGVASPVRISNTEFVDEIVH